MLDFAQSDGPAQCLNTAPTLTADAHRRCNVAEPDPTTVTLFDSHGEGFIVDADDAFAVDRYPWCIDRYGYAATHIGKWPVRTRLKLHQFLLGVAPKGFQWDHINRDKLDNRRSNLRLVTKTQNMRNRSIRSDNTSGVDGVRGQFLGRWQAHIKVAGRTHYLGTYDSLEEAAAARARAEKELW